MSGDADGSEGESAVEDSCDDDDCSGCGRAIGAVTSAAAAAASDV